MSSLQQRNMDAENSRAPGAGKPVAAPAAGVRRTGTALAASTAVNGRAPSALPAASGLARPAPSSYASMVPAPAAAHHAPSHSDLRMDTSSDASMAAMMHHHAGSGSSLSAFPPGADIIALPPIPANVQDVDALDREDPASVSDYAREIHAHQKLEEITKSARYGYMALQTDINEKMRAILLDWLEEVHVKFKLMPETLYLTANLIDRFLEKKIVIRSKLQLVGVTAMLIASKYEEIYAPEVRDFVYITDKAYTREQILAMEATMLNTLDFRVSVPTVLVFLNRYLKVTGAPSWGAEGDRLVKFATFLVERQVQEYRMLQHPPSKIAASAVNMALRSLKGRGTWTPTLEFQTGYSERELRSCIQDMQDVMAASVTSSLQAVRKKYSNPKFGEVANITLALLE